jgi:hypothetical protein
MSVSRQKDTVAEFDLSEVNSKATVIGAVLRYRSDMGSLDPLTSYHNMKQ